MEDNKSIKDCIQLINKLPIQNLDENINAISNLIYENDDLLNEFLQKVDNRTEVCNEDSLGDFIKCEQNRDGDSYRSPHSNYYFPPMEDGRYPRKDLRDLEVKLNKIFGLYSKSYYSPTTIASVYCWELGPEIEDGFAVCAAFKNEVKYEKEINAGRWDSTNLVNVSFEKDDSNNISVIFKLTTTVILHMSFNHPSCGNVILVGTVGRQVRLCLILKETRSASN